MIKAPGAPMAQRHVDDLFFYCTLGVIFGGRLGYALFYTGGSTGKPSLFTHFTPGTFPSWDLLRLWDGGMSFHGGLVGILIAMALFTRSKGGNILSSFDLLGAIGTIGLFLGRIANFINGELYGAPTNLPWAVVFPTDPQGLPRHPSELYEAGLEGVLLFAIIFAGTRWLGWLKRPGLTGGVFGVGYALSRILVEFVRLPDAQLGYLLGTGWLTMGQVLSLPVLIAGLAFIAYAMVRPRA
jgi:phosphatidylglycerol:prolipoprotein diacylglycerol transferase